MHSMQLAGFNLLEEILPRSLASGVNRIKTNKGNSAGSVGMVTLATSRDMSPMNELRASLD